MKYRTYLSLLLFGALLLFVMSCGKDPNCVEEEDQNCLCYMNYDPVCGCNNKTYGNACAADCAGVEYTAGACN